MQALFVVASLSLATLAASSILGVHVGQQSYRVDGRLRCGSQPAADVFVKLIDIDFSIDPDDDMDSGYTDASGRFVLEGTTTEGTTIDPFLKIYHDCNDGIRPCQRRWKFELPNKYITGGHPANQTMHMGEWNLEAILPDEEHDCIH